MKRSLWLAAAVLLPGLAAALLWLSQRAPRAGEEPPATQQAAPAVISLSFDPAGDMLAVVVGDAEQSRGGRLYLFRSGSEQPALEAPCLSANVQWLREPTRLIYAAEELGDKHLVVLPVESGEARRLSLPIEATFIGPIGIRGDTVAFLAGTRQGGYDLCRWQVARPDIERSAVPEQFRPLLTAPPAISDQGKLVALVHHTGSYFAAFDAASGSWLKPVCRAAGWGGWTNEWEWRPLGADPVDITLWRTAFINVERPRGPDRFFVDEKSLCLWVAIRGRSHVTPTPQGPRLWFLPDSLYPLDLDAAKAAAPYSAERRVVFPPIIWAEEAAAMSSSSARDRIAVIYPTEAGHECRLAWRREPGDTEAESTLVSDPSVLPSAVAMSGDGKRVALLRRTDADRPPRVEILDTATGEALAAWDLGVLNSSR